MICSSECSRRQLGDVEYQVLMAGQKNPTLEQFAMHHQLLELLRLLRWFVFLLEQIGN